MSWTSLAYIDSHVIERISEGDLATFEQALSETDRKIRGLGSQQEPATQNDGLPKLTAD
jgi:hypothetical protein